MMIVHRVIECRDQENGLRTKHDPTPGQIFILAESTTQCRGLEDFVNPFPGGGGGSRPVTNTRSSSLPKLSCDSK